MDTSEDFRSNDFLLEFLFSTTSVKQLCRLVDDLLDLTHITYKNIELKNEVFEINSLALSVVEDNRPLFENRGVKLTASIKCTPRNVNADPARIRQIIDKLLANALQFTDSGGETFMSVYIENNESVVCVKDTGIGIKPEMMPTLFDPFTQADSSLDRRNGGLGLGLSIVKGIAELQGGSVSAFSEGLGKGSTFKIKLPLYQNDSIQNSQRMPNKENRPHKILLIEDNRDFSDILRWALKLLGHEVITAFDGMAGVTKADDYLPNVIFCDIGLPQMNGFEVAKRIKSNNAMKDVFLIALTGYEQQQDIDMAIQSGYNQHLSKPINMETIKNILNF